MNDKEWIAALQAALSFWLPQVQGNDEMAKRIANDAWLLCGMDHADADKPSAEKLGWIKVAAAAPVAAPMEVEQIVEIAEKHEYKDVESGNICFDRLGFARALLAAAALDVPRWTPEQVAQVHADAERLRAKFRPGRVADPETTPVAAPVNAEALHAECKRVAHNAIHDAIYKIDDCEPVKDAVRDALDSIDLSEYTAPIAAQTEPMTGAKLAEGMAYVDMQMQFLPINPEVPHGDQCAYTLGSVPLYKLAEAFNAVAAAPVADDKDRRIAELEASLKSCYCYTPEHIDALFGKDASPVAAPDDAKEPK